MAKFDLKKAKQEPDKSSISITSGYRRVVISQVAEVGPQVSDQSAILFPQSSQI